MNINRFIVILVFCLSNHVYGLTMHGNRDQLTKSTYLDFDEGEKQFWNIQTAGQIRNVISRALAQYHTASAHETTWTWSRRTGCHHFRKTKKRNMNSWDLRLEFTECHDLVLGPSDAYGMRVIRSYAPRPDLEV